MNSNFNILVTGANGQVGMELRALAGNYPSFRFFFAGRSDLSINDKAQVELLLQQHKFTHCINCAAYTAVDLAENETVAAFETNAKAVEYLARACKQYNVLLVHFSTDYVFDGNAVAPYKESDPTNPEGVYGASKLGGEQALLNTNPDAIIIRTSWVYSSYGKNFVKTMMRLMNEKERIGVVNDQYGSPTYAADLAAAVMTIISAHPSPLAGVYHYSNEGRISWYEFALEIKRVTGSGCVVSAITTAEYPTAAKRPHYSVLDTTLIKKTFDLTIPDWKDSLRKCIAKLQR